MVERLINNSHMIQEALCIDSDRLLTVLIL